MTKMPLTVDTMAVDGQEQDHEQPSYHIIVRPVHRISDVPTVK